MVKREWQIVLLALCAILVIQACSQTSRHKVLCFFFDGVPPLEAEGSGSESPGDGAVEEGVELTVQQQIDAAFKNPIYSHAPYRDNLCKECHDMAKGKLVQEPEEGLCMRCHEGLTYKLRFVHGPVAVNACLECHHFHFSPNPGITLVSGDALCFRCHEQEELLPGAHHVKGEAGCLDCHHPHGGNDPYFVRQIEP